MSYVNMLTPADVDYLRNLPRGKELSTLFAWLYGKNDRRSAIAAALMAQMGTLVTSWLLSNATSKRKNLARKARYLDAIRKVGLPLNAEHLMLLLLEMRKFPNAFSNPIIDLLSWNKARSIQETERVMPYA